MKALDMKSISFQTLNDRRSIFFKRNGKIGVSYDWVEIRSHTTVPHYGAAARDLEPASIPGHAGFFGCKDGNWYYVEMAYSNNHEKQLLAIRSSCAACGTARPAPATPRGYAAERNTATKSHTLFKLSCQTHGYPGGKHPYARAT